MRWETHGIKRVVSEGRCFPLQGRVGELCEDTDSPPVLSLHSVSKESKSDTQVNIASQYNLSANDRVP